MSELYRMYFDNAVVNVCFIVFEDFFLIYKSTVLYEQMILDVLSCLFSNEVVMICRRIFFVQIAISNLKIF